MQTKIKKKGFALLETIVYVSILTVLSVSLVSSLLLLNQSLQRIVIYRIIDDSAQEVMEKIIREVRAAHTVDTISSVFSINPSTLVLDTTDTIGNPEQVEFSVISGRLELERNTASLGFLTPQEITIDEFILDRIVTPQSEAIKVSLLLSGTRGLVTVSETFNTTVILRGSY